MYDPEADVSRWNLEREAFQTRYFTELKRRYKLDFSHDMPARMEEASRKLLESCFGGFFLRPDTLGWIWSALAQLSVEVIEVFSDPAVFHSLSINIGA
jgi:hypothetical protein